MEIGRGVVEWDRSERVTNRYGYINLGKWQGPAKEKDVWIDEDAAKGLEGKHVKLSAVVTENRQSGHIGDIFLGIYPTQPEVGEEVVIGVGKLSLSKNYAGETSVGLKPSDDRPELWLDPRKLYRLHNQSVILYADETTEPETPSPYIPMEYDGVKSCGDGTIQTKGVEVEDIKVAPQVESLGDGLFIMHVPSHTPIGTRHESFPADYSVDF